MVFLLLAQSIVFMFFIKTSLDRCLGHFSYKYRNPMPHEWRYWDNTEHSFPKFYMSWTKEHHRNYHNKTCRGMLTISVLLLPLQDYTKLSLEGRNLLLVDLLLEISCQLVIIRLLSIKDSLFKFYFYAIFMSYLTHFLYFFKFQIYKETYFVIDD